MILPSKRKRPPEVSHSSWDATGRETADAVAEEATIFAQCLIALRKLNSNTITLWFDETIGEDDIKSTDTKVKPYYMGDEPEIGKGLPEVAVSHDQALQGAGDLSFGYTEDSAW
jgi:hypothetical protein